MPVPYYFILMFFILSFFSGCEKEMPGNKEEEINLELDLSPRSDFNAVTRAQSPDSSIGLPEADNFKIQLFNTAGELLKEWATFSAVPHPIKLQATKFRIKASYGNPDKSGFDCPAFSGDTLIQVKGAKEKRVTLNTSFAHILASVDYRDRFKNLYRNYSTLILSANDTVVFNKEEKRTAFLPAGKLQVVLNLSKNDTATRTIVVATLPKTKAAEYYRFHIDAESGVGYEKLFVSFDSGTIARPIEIKLPQEWQAHKKPYLTPKFNPADEHSYLLGTSCEAGSFHTLVTAIGKIGSCKVSTTSQDLIALGWPAEFDLTNLTGANQTRLKQFGLKWSENMAHSNMAELDFSGIVAKLPAGDQALTVQVADILGQLSEPLTLRFSIIPPQFHLEQPEQPAIARSPEYTFHIRMNGGNPQKIRIECFEDFPAFNKQEWKECTILTCLWNETKDMVAVCTKTDINKPSLQFRAKYDKTISEEVTLNVINPTFRLHKEFPEWAHRVKLYIQQTDGTNGLVQNSSPEQYFIETSTDGHTWNKNGYSGMTIDKINHLIKVQANNLADGQTYYIRAGFDSKAGLDICYSEPISIQTEAATQVPNAEMEDWHYTRPQDVKYWEIYYACKEGESPIWNTMNRLTTSEGGTSTSITNRNGCRYSANSGTIQTEDKVSGKYAALIRTVGWGKNNSAAPFDSNKMGTCQYITPGQLYLGNYNNVTKEVEYGYSFASRPDTLKFYYKYIPKNPEDYGYVEINILDTQGNSIASNSMNLTSQNTYSDIKLPLDYKNDFTTKAASMYIVFKSSANAECLSIDVKNLTPPPARNLSDGEYIGSQLYIDNVELIYK